MNCQTPNHNEISLSARKRREEANKFRSVKRRPPLPPLDYSEIYPAKLVFVENEIEDESLIDSEDSLESPILTPESTFKTGDKVDNSVMCDYTESIIEMKGTTNSNSKFRKFKGRYISNNQWIKSLDEIKFLNDFMKQNFEEFSQHLAELKFKCALQNEEIIFLRNKIQK
eukprot:gene8421-246_t